MLKVCHVISGYYRNDPRIFQRMCKSLQNNGYEVSILTNDSLGFELKDNVSIYSCKIQWSSRLKILLFAKQQFKNDAIDINADVYHLHSPELLSLGLYLKKIGKIVLYDAHEDLPMHILEKDWLPKFIRPFLSSLVSLYMNFVYKKIDGITTPHLHVKEKLFKVNNNVEEITNYAKTINTTNFTFEDYTKRSNNICYSGTVYLHSNQLNIVKAINELNINEYLIAGFIDNEYLTKLKSLDENDKLKFIGRIEWELLSNFYEKSIAGIVVIDYKMNLGNKKGTNAVNKVFEYMEAGLPIICSDYDIWVEMVDKYKCGICVQPGNYFQLKEAISYLLNNKNIAYEMGQNGKRAILTEYNWENQETKYLKLIDNILNCN